MSASNRAQLIKKLHKVAKKHYPAVAPITSRGVLEHMLYACCLQNSMQDAADEAFAKLEEKYFDWNEVRVTTTQELSESMKGLTEPMESAQLLKKTLHGVFETYYKFDLDFLKKENLRKTVQQFSNFRGVSSFVASYTAQMALGGHFIPLDDAVLELMKVIGIISADEAAKEKVPGLERTISKNQGIEFASVVHQLAATFFKSPHNKDIRAIILSIASDAADRFPKRGAKKKVAEEKAKPEPKAKKVPESVPDKATKKKAAAKTTKPTKATTGKKAPAKKAAKKSPTKKAPIKKKTTKKAAPNKKKAAKTTKKVTKKKSIVKKAAKTAKKGSSSKKLARKKPR